MTPGEARKPIVFVDCTPWFGGAQRSFLTLAHGVQEKGVYDARVLTADVTTGGMAESCERVGIPCHLFRARHWQCSVRGLLSFLVVKRTFRRAWRESCQDGPPALVHANGMRAGLLAVGVLPAGVPLVVHERDWYGPGVVRRYVSGRARCVIAVSEAVRLSLAQVGVTDGVEVTYNGLDVSAMRDVEPTPANPWMTQHFVAVNVGDMVGWKRHELFLKSIKQGLTTIPELRGVVVGRALTEGGKQLLADLLRLADVLGIAEQVHFVSDAQDALPWIAAADVLVSTADKEPFGRVIVEALATGKPVVATGGGGPEEILSECAASRVVDADPVAITAGLRDFRDKALRQGLRKAALSRAERFGVDRMVDAAVTLYGRLLQG